MICKNCNHPVSNKYCENCGQKVRTEQLTYAYIMKDLNESFFSLNKGFFHTFRELTCRPAQCIREFFAGKRRIHYKPISYLILCASIYSSSQSLPTKTLGWQPFLEILQLVLKNHRQSIYLLQFIGLRRITHTPLCSSFPCSPFSRGYSSERTLIITSNTLH